MLIKSEKLAVSPITTHIDLREVSKKIDIRLISKKIETIHNWYRKFLKKAKNCCFRIKSTQCRTKARL